MDKYYSEIVLLEQKYVKDTEVTVADRISDTQTQLGEKIAVGQFVRFKVGE